MAGGRDRSGTLTAPIAIPITLHESPTILNNSIATTVLLTATLSSETTMHGTVPHTHLINGNA